MCSRRVAIRGHPTQRRGEFVGALFYRFATVRSHVLLIEHMIDYRSNTRANAAKRKARTDDSSGHPRSPGSTGSAGVLPPVRGHDGRLERRRAGGGPAARRCTTAVTGVVMSRASHRRRPITPATTVGPRPAGRADHGVARCWWHSSAGSSVPRTRRRRCPTRLPWFRCSRGRRCSRSPHRVAPDAPVAQVVDRIRELNKLESASLDAGQTLIAPVG